MVFDMYHQHKQVKYQFLLFFISGPVEGIRIRGCKKKHVLFFFCFVLFYPEFAQRRSAPEMETTHELQPFFLYFSEMWYWNCYLRDWAASMHPPKYAFLEFYKILKHSCSVLKFPGSITSGWNILCWVMIEMGMNDCKVEREIISLTLLHEVLLHKDRLDYSILQ